MRYTPSNTYNRDHIVKLIGGRELPNTDIKFKTIRVLGKGWFVHLYEPIDEEFYRLIWKSKKGLGEFYEGIAKSNLEARLINKQCPLTRDNISFIADSILNSITNEKYKHPWDPNKSTLKFPRKYFYSSF